MFTKALKLNALFVLSLLFATPVWPAGNTTGNPILDPSAMDTSVNPCQDFYQYACGNWLNRTTIPSDQSEWARSFSVLSEQNWAILHNVLTDYSNGKFSPPTPYAQQLGDYYGSCMDTKAIDAQTPAAIAAAMQTIDKLTDKADLPSLVAQLQLQGVPVLFSFSSTPDLKQSTLEVAEVDQGGMGLPDSTYYKKTDKASQQIREAYVAHITKMLELAGFNTTAAQDSAKKIMAFETSLAQSALPPEDLQDPAKIYHPGSLDVLQKMTPDFNWSEFIKDLGIATPPIVNVTESKFMNEMNTLVKTTSLDDLKLYLKWKSLEAMAPTLGTAVYAEWFHFNATVLNGQSQMSPRWKTCVRAVSNGMSEALGQAFVAKAFGPAQKARVAQLIANLKAAFSSDLQNLDWLDAQTRAAALTKLEQFGQKIGYPENWRNYDALKITRGSYWQNGQNAAVFEAHRELNKIGGKVDPTEWAMSPQTVNAYYDPSLNQINFPAAILQPPFFSQDADDASNYGAIGMVIGHEMTHGFDTSGSQFDGHGVLDNWWTPQVKKLFSQKAQCLINQYSQYEPLPGVKVNGQLTITENIADQGGLKLAYLAYQMSKQGKKDDKPIAGLNGNQQFFVSMAQMWCEKQTDQALRSQVSSDPHSPGKYRVIGTVVNNPYFAHAFNCPVGSPMAPKNTCSIW